MYSPHRSIFDAKRIAKKGYAGSMYTDLLLEGREKSSRVLNAAMYENCCKVVRFLKDCTIETF
jgi:hypothetical protein